MINLEWLRTFKTVYEKGSMTAAADHLYISQPGVSLHLSSLEEHVGYKLFERTPRKLTPTERGKILYNGIVDPIMKLEAIERNSQLTSNKENPTIAVGMCFETFQETLEKYVQDFGFDLILEFADYAELLDKLGKGLLDVVVTPHKGKDKELTYTPISQENIILAAGKTQQCDQFFELLETKRNDELLKWMKRQKWYGIAGDNEHWKRFWQLNFKANPDLRPNYTVPNIHSVVRGLSSGPGLAIIPDFLCREEVQRGDIRILWEGYSPLTNTLYLASKRHPTHAQEIEVIKDILLKELPALSPGKQESQ